MGGPQPVGQPDGRPLSACELGDLDCEVGRPDRIELRLHVGEEGLPAHAHTLGHQAGSVSEVSRCGQPLDACPSMHYILSHRGTSNDIKRDQKMKSEMEITMRSTGSTLTRGRPCPVRRSAAPAALGGLWLGLVVTAGLTAGIGARLRVVLAAGSAGAGVDRIIEGGVLAVGQVLAAWLTLSVVLAALCATGRAGGRTWRAGERLVIRCAPGIVRRALVIAVGAGIGLSAASGASASAAGDGDLGWVVTAATVTATATASTVSSAASMTPTPGPPAARSAQRTNTEPDAVTVIVEQGDSLWRVARRSLPAGAEIADIASAWPAWYAANEDVIGDDPNLLKPGQALRTPLTNRSQGAS